MATRFKPRKSWIAAPAVVAGIPRPVVELRNGLPINFGSSGNVQPVANGGIIDSVKGANRLGFRNPNTSSSSSDYVDLGTSADICTVPFTYFLEFALDSTANITSIAVSAQGALGFCIQLRCNSSAIDLLKQNVALIGSSAAVLIANKRHRAAVTYDGTNAVFVVDGRSVTKASSAQTFTHGNFAVAGGRGSGTENYAHTLSLFRMWGRVLPVQILLRMTAPDANPRNETYAVAGAPVGGTLFPHRLIGNPMQGGRLVGYGGLVA